MTAREEVLQRVRAAIGRKPGQAPAPQPKARIQIPVIPAETRIALFTERLEALGGKVYRAATFAGARGIVAGLIGQDAAAASTSPVLDQAGIPALPNVLSGFTKEAPLRAACATVPYGITSADYGLAETGSLVVRSASEARLVSLLPPVHIAILPARRLLTGLDELFTLEPRPADATASMVLITGPSRSADIEMILVRGVHGPKAIHVIVVDEDAL